MHSEEQIVVCTAGSSQGQEMDGQKKVGFQLTENINIILLQNRIILDKSNEQMQYCCKIVTINFQNVLHFALGNGSMILFKFHFLYFSFRKNTHTSFECIVYRLKKKNFVFPVTDGFTRKIRLTVRSTYCWGEERKKSSTPGRDCESSSRE